MNQENERKLDIEKLAGELKVARDLVNGLAAPYELINEDNFPLLHTFASQSLDMLRNFAKMGFESDTHRYRVSINLPDAARLWPNDGERMFLIAAFEIGLFDEAFDVLKRNYKDDIEHGKSRKEVKDRKVGFGGV